MTLLPTPNAHPSGSTPEQHLARKPGRTQVTELSIVVEHLLPTPTAMDMGRGHTVEEFDGWTDAMKARHGNGNGHGKSLEIEALRHLGTFGPYQAAVDRWAGITGRPAPLPTEPGKDGRPRLSAVFVEWLMDFPEGWVTDVPGVTRTNQLKILGNAVLPAQALLALRLLTSDPAP